MEHRVPRDAAEEGMALHIRRAILQIANALCSIFDQQTTDQVLRNDVDKDAGRLLFMEGQKLDAAIRDFLVGIKVVRVVERRIAVEHLVQQNAQRPPIDGRAVPLTENNLGGNIVGRATYRECPIIKCRLQISLLCFLIDIK